MSWGAGMRHFFVGHARLFVALILGAAGVYLLPQRWGPMERAIAGWDMFCIAFLAITAPLLRGLPPSRMEANARAQETGEWTLFFMILTGAIISFAAIIAVFGAIKQSSGAGKAERVGVVAATLLLSWLLTQVIFALRYAHEYYSRSPGAHTIDRGLDFPSEKHPDYGDFLYFSVVLGMTFQVSDVQITARKFRRLATLHGLLGFLFNTVIIALTVNLASGLLG